MNKNKAILKRIPLLLMALFLFYSCSMEQELDAPDVGTSEITFTAKLPAMEQASTRATNGTLAENRVRQLDLLVFAKDGNLKEIKKVKPTYNEDTDAIHQTVKFRTRLTAGNYDFMLVANARSLISFTENETVSQADVAKALIFSSSTILTLGDSDTGVIPMWARLKDVTMADGKINKTTFDINLTRIHARIDVLANSIITTTFKLESVAFYNYNTKGCIVPAEANYPITTASNNPSLPASPTPVNNTAIGADVSPYTFAPTATNKCEGKIYVLEATTTPYNTTGWKTSPCLIIGGRYGGTSQAITYYRIDFIGTNKAGTANQPLNILRNHLYKVNIIAVTGRGYDTAAEALNYIPSNSKITSTITPWDSNPYADVSVDGPYYLGVNSSVLNYTAAGGEQNITLKSNLNWKAEYYNTNGTVLSSSWFTFKNGAKTGNAGENLTLTIKVTASGGVKREGYILFSAGRMKVRVNVKQ
ncbi:fimbrial protein [Bacteroides sp. 224]|uniref:fimbrial protein n=1 Tax=Bacteroides sp. 224 TaxID=2302936 RepID=UPI0013D36AFD|nr:fimbrial protein [Bacteroides sp. 224]NDV66572.1 hypothetical protein [Bacteroides sp. 224]